MVKEGGKIDQHLDLIAGLPEEDYTRFKQTFNDVFEMRPEELQLGFLKMLRGTGLRLRAEDHGYVYMDHAPYEMLKNNILSFSDISRIKRVEDVLEKYWNDHRMDHTIEYLVEHTFSTPFDFFQDFGDYWEKQGWSRIGHQLEDLFLRLHEFLLDIDTEHLSVIEGLMKYDYFLHQKHKPRKVWWEHTLSKKEHSSLLKSLAHAPSLAGPSFESLQASEKELHKHSVTELLDFSLSHYLQTGTFLKEPEYLIVYYHTQTKEKQVFHLPLSSAKIVEA